MTISTEAIVAGPFVGNDAVDTYAFAFKVFSDADVLVKHTSVTGVDRTAVLTTDYSVSRNADQDLNPGGTITWKISGVTAFLPASEKVTITSQVANTQGTALPSGGSYAAKTVERMIDKVTILVKQFGRSVVRSIRQPITDATTMNELPNATERAESFLYFDADGHPTAAAGIADAPVSAAMAPVVAAASTSAGLTALGFSTFFKTLIGAASAAALRVLLLIGTKSTVASHATTADIWTGTGDLIDFTGNTGPITAFPAAPQAGESRWLLCASTPQFNHGADLIVPGSANYIATAGDLIRVLAETTTRFRLSILKANGSPVVAATPASATESAEGVIEIATEAEIETGTSNVLAVTPGRLFGAIGFTEFYDSGNQTITAAGALTLAHGIGRKPALMQVYLKCTDAGGDVGYAQNDEVLWGLSDSGAFDSRGVAIWGDTTNVNVRFGSQANSFALLNKTTGTLATITATKWVAIFRAWG